MSDALRLRDLLEGLVAADVRFVLVGGLALNAWGYLRATQDIDIVPDPDSANLDRLATLLESLDGKVEVQGGRLAPSAIRTFLKAGDRTLVSTDAGHVDVLQGHPQVPAFAALEADATSVDLDGIVVRVCSLEALKSMKRTSERARDRDDLEALEALEDE
jgi:predicted nucleotidyltransferase